MIDTRIRVTKLHRMNPSSSQQGYWYYSPDGHVVGPFSSQEEREKRTWHGIIKRFHSRLGYCPMTKFASEENNEGLNKL